MSRAKPGWELGNMATGRPCTVFAPRRLKQRTCPDKKENPTAECSPGGFCFKGRQPTRQEDNNAAVGIPGDTSCYATVASRHNGEVGVQRKEEKRRICADVAGLAAMSVFCAEKGSCSGLRRGRWWGRKKKRPPAELSAGGRLVCKGRQPTLPHSCAVPSARAGLTSLFGMGRGGTPPP